MDARRNLLQELKLVDNTDADIKNIQEVTINQTESKEWNLQRKRRLTASIFHAICHLRETTKGRYASEIFERKDFSSRTTTHGLLNEKVALAQFCANNDLQIKPCGLLVMKKKKTDDTRRTRNIAIAEYFTAKKQCVDAQLNNLNLENDNLKLKNIELKLQNEKLLLETEKFELEKLKRQL
ncbi:unnamed protein product [Euphydryas editha]|uniref:Uncharacterized protein n=1 Tax=Euphydryas editha TaxID=104508 RepID=A0AAU9UP14_EUPED|nr:unnamed protein product [Euphydryas editha]